MKKFLLLIIGFGLFYLNIYGTETPREQPVQEQLPQEQPQPRKFVRTRRVAGTPTTTRRTPAATRRTSTSARRVSSTTGRGTRAPARRAISAPTRGRRTAPARPGMPVTPGRPVVRGRVSGKPVSAPQVKLEKPESLDVLIWNNLSENQKEQFIELNTSFIETISVVSKNINLWQRTVVERAKKIIDINSALVDYCIAVITAELEKTAEERNVNAKTTSDFIANTLRTYAFQSFIKIGTEKEQFYNLMENITLDPSTNMPTQDWVDAVMIRAKSLIDKKELTIEQVRKSITDGLREASGQVTLSSNLTQVVNVIINSITQSIAEKKSRMEREQRESTPEYVYNWFQGLLLQVGDTSNWNNLTNKPNEVWIKNIIVAGKKMIAVFNIPLDDIEQQIGAQVYFVAFTKKGGVVTQQEEKSIIDLVTFIKQQIGKQ